MSTSSGGGIAQAPSWCFVYGSMLNLLSLRLRDIEPMRTSKAILPEFKRVFVYPSGAATVVPEEGSQVCGAVHLLTPDGLKMLVSYERGYDLEVHDVFVEDQIFQAKVFVMTQQRLDSHGGLKEHPPTHRYLSIIIQGAENLGLPEAELAKLRHTPFRSPPSPPYKAPWRDLDCVPKTMTLAEVKQLCSIFHKPNQSDSLKCTCEQPTFVLNKSVLQCVPNAGEFWKTRIRDLCGRDATHHYAKLLYDPQYPPAWKLEDMSDEHRDTVESDVCFGALKDVVHRIAVFDPKLHSVL
eukprot:c996_g1_i1.p1 GENE.c996_g1_i1~~c996_g1_i1.p1  ORF type:complete len:307 (-),score=51.48 c996_g1_i1:32-916(-)